MSVAYEQRKVIFCSIALPYPAKLQVLQRVCLVSVIQSVDQLSVTSPPLWVA